MVPTLSWEQGTAQRSLSWPCGSLEQADSYSLQLKRSHCGPLSSKSEPTQRHMDDDWEIIQKNVLGAEVITQRVRHLSFMQLTQV